MDFKLPDGAATALVTPFYERGSIDWDALNKLVIFQICNGISMIVPVGTTGESSTLTGFEHKTVITETLRRFSKDIFVMPGCGSNCTHEAMEYVECVSKNEGKAVLLVDPYYNGPSSLEIRREYYTPIASVFTDMLIVPYVIPGRTGCALLPEDLAILYEQFPNVCAVKEATGNNPRIEKTRYFTSKEFQIFSGDDSETLNMMVMSTIKASGVISVISNIAPAAVQAMCRNLLLGEWKTAISMHKKLSPLFNAVTVNAERGDGLNISDRFRNPLPIKTMMNGLGMPVGLCRQPLGKMSKNGVCVVRNALSQVWEDSPEILTPIEKFFNVDIGSRLKNDDVWANLSY